MQPTNARFRSVFQPDRIYDVNNARSMPRAVYFLGGKAYRMPGVYLPRITEPRRCWSTGKRRGAKRETVREKERGEKEGRGVSNDRKVKT